MMNRQKGVGLVEVMVSVTIGLLILVGVVQLYISSVQTQRSQEGYSRIQENMRYLSSIVGQDLNQAGYLGCMAFNPEFIFNFLAKESGVAANTPQRYNFTGSFVSGGEGDGVNGTDTMSLRFVSQQSIPLAQPFKPATQDQAVLVNAAPYTTLYSQLQQWQVVVMSNCGKAHVLMITDVPAADGTIKFERDKESTSTTLNQGQKNVVPAAGNTDDRYVPRNDEEAFGRLFIGGVGANFYEIKQSARGSTSTDGAACSASNPHSCGLFRNGEEIVDGVSDFQVEYGWVNGTQVRYGNASQVAAANGWANVDRIKIDVTLSALDATGTLDNDASRRVQKSFSQVFMLRNRPI